MLGHFAADLDPLKLDKRAPPVELDPAFFGFTEADLDRECVLLLLLLLLLLPALAVPHDMLSTGWLQVLPGDVEHVGLLV